MRRIKLLSMTVMLTLMICGTAWAAARGTWSYYDADGELVGQKILCQGQVYTWGTTGAYTVYEPYNGCPD